MSYSENGTASVGTYKATDPDGDTISWSLPNTSHETDRADFSISSDGVLRFRSSPDFESPHDSDRNNVYKVTVRASDGRGGTADRNVTVTVTNVNEAPVSSEIGDRTLATVRFRGAGTNQYTRLVKDTYLDISLDSIFSSGKGLADSPSYDFQVGAQNSAGSYQAGAYSDPITIIDNPLLTEGGRAYGSGDQEASLQWRRIADATEYTIEYRILTWRDYVPGHSPNEPHWDLDWPSDEDWPYYESEAGSLNSPKKFEPVTVQTPSATIRDLPTLRVFGTPPNGEPFSGIPLIRTQLYAFRVNYVTTSGKKVFSARDAYVWPSADFPRSEELVGTYTFFGHHANKNFEHILCKETFPANEREQWIDLIKSAFEQWATSTNQFIIMTPRVHGVGGWRCSDTSTTISQFIMEDDERSEIRMLDTTEGGLPVTGSDPDWTFSETKSDVFKICASSAPACVTSFTGYAGNEFPSEARLRIAQIVNSWLLAPDNRSAR